MDISGTVYFKAKAIEGSYGNWNYVVEVPNAYELILKDNDKVEFLSNCKDLNKSQLIQVLQDVVKFLENNQ